jgi:hypothetical protein
MLTEQEHTTHREALHASKVPKNRKWVGGVALILVGALLLLATLTNSDWYSQLLLPVLGVIFLSWGMMASRPGPIIPGGILTGLGVGIVLSQQVFHFTGLDEGGLITLSLGMGFLLILPLSKWFTPKWHWWPTIPGSILVVVGSALLIGNSALEVLTVLGKIWPVGLIVAGVILLWQFWRRR